MNKIAPLANFRVSGSMYLTLAGLALLPLQEGDHGAPVLWECHRKLWIFLAHSKCTVPGPGNWDEWVKLFVLAHCLGTHGSDRSWQVSSSSNLAQIIMTPAQVGVEGAHISLLIFV